MALLALCLGAAALGVIGFIGARGPVIVASYVVQAAHLRCSAQPFRVVVMGDLHVSRWSTPPERIAQAVKLANAQSPDLVVLVGDYFGHGWPRDVASRAGGLMPLRDLRPRIATVAIMGNNDWTDGVAQITKIMTRHGVIVLDNDALLTPEVAVMGVADISSDTANPQRAIERYRAMIAQMRIPEPPLKLWLAHDPLMVDRMPGTDDMLFAGHTHGGQFLPNLTIPVMRQVVVILRMLGFKASWPAEKYRYGDYYVGHKRMIVTSGIGTSGLPLRLGVPPEIALASFTGCTNGH